MPQQPPNFTPAEDTAGAQAYLGVDGAGSLETTGAPGGPVIFGATPSIPALMGRSPRVFTSGT